ncbi:MAG: hypothetical protein V1789_04250 [PVC group bacterium]
MKKTASRNQLVVAVYFLFLFGALLIIFLPTFSNPPRSDYWCLFYHFHGYQNLTALERIVNIANYDVWGHGTYRPLFHLVLYSLHLFFGARYFWFHAVTFGFYCFSIVLMYCVARRFGCGRAITMSFLAVFAFLFSHFDIVAWTFHLAVIVGFCLFLLGFLAYRRYLRSGRLEDLLIAVLLFLPGLLCYEVFIPWPAAVFILFFARRRPEGGPERFRAMLRASMMAVGGLYLFYGLIMAFARSRSAVTVPAAEPAAFFSLSAIGFSLAVTAVSLVFNGVIANIAPFLTCPALIQDNIGKGGVFLKASPVLRDLLASRSDGPVNLLVAPPLIISKAVDLDSLWRDAVPEINRFLAVAGGLIILFAIGGLFLLWKKRRPRNPGPFVFSLYLLLSSTFALYHGRMATNLPIYVLRQFRYQYISNALVILIALLAADRLVRALPRMRNLLYLLLALVAALNLLFLTAHLSVVNQQLAPLDRMLSNIKAGIGDGRISPERPIYIDDAIARSLPPLCWNHDMARFMKGTYQWVFSPSELRAFSFDPDQAEWIIDLETVSRLDIGHYRFK